MANTRKPQKDDEEKIVKENIQKRFKSMFSGQGEPLSNMSMQEVEALQARVSELEAKLAQQPPASNKEPLVPARNMSMQSKIANENYINFEEAAVTEVGQKQLALWISGTFIAVTVAFFGFAVYALLVLQGGKTDSSDPYLISFTALMVILTFLGHTLIRHDRATLGGWILYLIDAIVLPVLMVLFLDGMYAVASMYLVICALLFIAFIVPKASRRSAIVTGVGAILAIVAIEVWHPGFRVSDNHLETLIPFLIGLTLLVILLYLVRQSLTGNIRAKLITSFLAIALLSTGIVAILAQRSLSTSLTSNISSNLTELANSKAVEVGEAVDREADLLKALANNQKFQDAAVIANKTSSLSQADIEQLDKEWRNADAANNNSDPLVTRVLNNDIADELRQFHRDFPQHVEIFLTDRQGVSIASTNRTSDYYQADEEWWQTAYQNGMFIGQPEYDASSKTLAINMARAIRDNGTGEVVGVLRTTVDFTMLTDLLFGGQFGKTGHIHIYLPSGKELTLEPKEDGTYDLVVENGEIDMNLLDQSVSSSLQISHDGVPALASHAAMTVTGHKDDNAQAVNNLNWHIVVVQDRVEALKPVKIQTRNIVVAGILVSITVILAAFVLARLISAPLLDLNIVAQKIAAGDLTATAKVESHDEIAVLATTFNNMTAQLQDLFGSLEQRVLDRTHDLELATEVGRAVSEKVGDLSEMLSQAAELIRTRFNLYYTQIYLMDASGKNIILRAGTGEVGKELLKKGYHLPIRSSSLNGRAASEKHAVIVTDTKNNPSFLPNPMLPNTRSEMCVPLIVSGKVVGVLDMQSEQPGALSEANLPAFQALAGQLAIAIQNAALFTEANEARVEVEAQIQRITERGWQDFLDAIERGRKIGYTFDQSKITPLEIEALLRKTADSDLSIPVAVTGTKIGEIQLPIEQGHTWTSDELELVKSTSAQLAQHVENLRLLAQAERYRNEAEQAVRQLTHEGWNAHLQSNNELASGYIFDLNEVQTLSGNGNNNFSALIQSLTVHDETIGELAVDTPDQSEEAAEVIAAVAEQLSAHIENLRLLKQTEEQQAETNTLYEIGQKISVAKNQQEIVAAVAENVGLSQINRAVLLSYEYNVSGELETITVTGNWHSGRGSLPTPLGRQYPAKVFTIVNFFNGTDPGFVSDTQNDKRVDPASAAVFKAQNIHAFASLPLWDDTHQIGSLLLESEETISFTGKELLPYRSIMQQVGIAVENQVLFEQTQKRAKREQTLREITNALRSSTNPATIMRTAVRELGSIFGRRTVVQMARVERTNQVESTVSNEDESSSSAN